MPKLKRTPAHTAPAAGERAMQLAERFAAAIGGEARVERIDDGSICVVDSAPTMRRAVFALERGAFVTRANPETGANEELLPVSFSSELPVRSWWGGDPEILSHDPEDADFSRLSQVGGVLRNHDPNQLIGAPVDVTLDVVTRKGRGYIRFGTTEAAVKARQEVDDGSMRGISVGYTVDEWVLLADENVSYKGRIKGPAWVAASWQALEFSLTPIPADPSVGVNRQVNIEETVMTKEQEAQLAAAAEAKRQEELKTKREEDARKAAEIAKVTPEKQTEAGRTVTPPETAGTDQGSAVRQAMSAERIRVRDIQAMGSRFNVPQEQIEDAIEDGLSVDAFSRQVIEIEGTRRQPVNAKVVQDGRASFAASVEEGLQLRAGRLTRDKIKSGGNVFASRTLIEIARECMQRAGLHTEFGDVRALVEAAMRGPAINSDLLARGAIAGGTSDFPYILANTANKSLIGGFRLARTTYELWAHIVSLNDFKSSSRIKVSETGDLLLIPEGGKYKETAMAESRETLQLGTFGRKMSMSRQAIINDDLQVFTTIPERLGRRAARKPNQLAVQVLLANAVLSDSVALFASGHNNYGADAGRSLADLAKAKAGLAYLVKLLRKQKAFIAPEEEEVEYLDLQPRVWLVNADDEIIARQTIQSVADASQSNAAVLNAFQGMNIQIAVEPNLQNTTYTGYSDTAHFLFADPAEAPVVEVAFLQGTREPYMEEVEQTDADGRIFKVRLDCVAGAVDYVGAAKEKGAA